MTGQGDGTLTPCGRTNTSFHFQLLISSSKETLTIRMKKTGQLRPNVYRTDGDYTRPRVMYNGIGSLISLRGVQDRIDWVESLQTYSATGRQANPHPLSGTG